MDAESLTHIIQLIIAPVVMVSACGLVLNTVLGRYNAVNDRMRDLGNERLALLKARSAAGPAAADDPFADERLREIDTQIPDLLRHHQLAHHAAQSVYAAIIFFLASMFTLALLARTNVHLFGVLALILFLTGIAILFIGVLITGSEIWNAQRAVQYEVRRVLALQGKAAAKAAHPQDSVLEVAMLSVKPSLEEAFEAAFATAVPIIATATGYLAHELHQCVEASGSYLLFVRWRSVEDHTVGFRQSPEYVEWRTLLERFYADAPIVQHFSGVAGSAARSALPVG